jgi:hypothetical protein
MAATLEVALSRLSMLDRVDDEWSERIESSSSPTGGGQTLDELLVGVWEGLATQLVVDCPICGATMKPRYGAGAAPVGGRCGRCGTTIAEGPAQ